MCIDTDVKLRDSFSKHGEELVRSRYAAEVRTRWLTWPQTVDSTEEDLFRSEEVIVAKVDGVVAGRAILDAVYYPFAEFENLEVVPAFRGKGIAGQIVAEATKRAADMGFLAIHQQVDLDDVAAHRLYAKHGFLPATQGKMLKLVRFLNYPALEHFLWQYPLSLYGSQPVEPSDATLWLLSWKNPLGQERISLQMRGGSCQADSHGFGPAITACEIRSDKVQLDASIAGASIVEKGHPFDVELKLINKGAADLEVAYRLLLNPECYPDPETTGGATLILRSNGSEKLTSPVQVSETFNNEVLKISAYRSVSTVVEVFAGDYVFWLSCQHKGKDW